MAKPVPFRLLGVSSAGQNDESSTTSMSIGPLIEEYLDACRTRS